MQCSSETAACNPSRQTVWNPHLQAPRGPEDSANASGSPASVTAALESPEGGMAASLGEDARLEVGGYTGASDGACAGGRSP